MIIEFSGLPRSGKSTQIDILRDYFERKGKSVIVIGEAAKKCPFDRRNRVEVACWMANNALNSIIEAKLGSKSNAIYLQDRGLFDSIAFFYLLNEEGYINGIEFKSYLDFFAVSRWFNYIDLIFYFDIQPSLTLSRDIARQILNDEYELNYPEGLITTPKKLEILHSSYKKIQVDYSNLLEKKVITHNILPDLSLKESSKLISQKINEKINSF